MVIDDVSITELHFNKEFTEAIEMKQVKSNRFSNLRSPNRKLKELNILSKLPRRSKRVQSLEPRPNLNLLLWLEKLLSTTLVDKYYYYYF